MAFGDQGSHLDKCECLAANSEIVVIGCRANSRYRVTAWFGALQRILQINFSYGAARAT